MAISTIKFSEMPAISASDIDVKTVYIPVVSGGENRVAFVGDIAQANGLAQVNQTSFVMNYPDNTADPSGATNIVLTAGTSQPSVIGVDEAWPLKGQTDAVLTAFLGWGPDAYTAGNAQVSTVVGGYDNINNGYASEIISSKHGMIAWNPEGHNTMVGGADCFISGTEFGDPDCGRASIFGARRSAVRGKTHGMILGGDQNRINSDGYSTIINGRDHNITNGQYNAIVGGRLNTITGSEETTFGKFSVILGGENIVIDGGDYALATGEGHLVQHHFAEAHGRDVQTIGAGIYQGVDQLVTQGDAQVVSAVGRVRTTTDANTNVTWANISAGSGNDRPIIFQATTAGTGTIRLIGMLDGNANGDSIFSQVSYKADFGFCYDGTKAFVFKDGAETGFAATTAEMALDLISQTNNDFSPATPPRIRLATNGRLDIRVNGLADTTINWVVHVDFVMTKVS